MRAGTAAQGQARSYREYELRNGGRNRSMADVGQHSHELGRRRERTRFSW